MKDTETTSALIERVEALERELSRTRGSSPTRRRFRGRLIGLGVTVLLLGGAAAIAAPTVSLTCPGGELYCFNPKAPAKANEVNHNFAQFQQWVEQKVGAVGTPEVRIQTGSNSNVAMAAGKPLFVSSSNIGPSTNGVEVRHDNLTQGIGIGYNTIYATGTNDDQPLNLAARGSERVRTSSPLDASDLYIGGTHIGSYIGPYIRDYIRANCRIYVGWRDSCETCNLAPERTSSIMVDGTGCATSGGQAWCSGAWAMVGFSGTMDANENIGVAFVCN